MLVRGQWAARAAQRGLLRRQGPAPFQGIAHKSVLGADHGELQDLSPRGAPKGLMASGSARQIHLLNNGNIKLSKEVQKALHSGTPVVALESTIISHGMPYPKNLECALEVEAAIYENGATPATVAIIDGVPCVGLDREELEKFASMPPEKVRKCSRRDIAVSIAMGECAATTVASTMILARQANIQVFVTGGIGGVSLQDKESNIDYYFTHMRRVWYLGIVHIGFAGTHPALNTDYLKIEKIETNFLFGLNWTFST